MRRVVGLIRFDGTGLGLLHPKWHTLLHLLISLSSGALHELKQRRRPTFQSRGVDTTALGIAHPSPGAVCRSLLHRKGKKRATSRREISAQMATIEFWRWTGSCGCSAPFISGYFNAESVGPEFPRGSRLGPDGENRRAASIVGSIRTPMKQFCISSQFWSPQ